MNDMITLKGQAPAVSQQAAASVLNNTATNNQNLRNILRDVLALFENFGVKPGIGQDGLLMARIQEELAGIKTITINTPNGACPICRAPDMLD